MNQKHFIAVTWAGFLALMLIATNFASTSASAANAAPLDVAGLKTMLENLGYEPKEGKYQSGRVYYEIQKKGQNVTVTTDIFLGNNGTLVWAYTPFRTLNEEQIPRDVLLEALSENNKNTYVYFCYAKPKLVLRGTLPNHDVKAADMRKLLDEMLVVADKTTHLWNPNFWKNKPEKK